MQAITVPEFGVGYPHDAVASFYKHDPILVSCVIVQGTVIVALRLRLDYNPKILARPAEVWVGETPQAVRDWGNILANQTGCVPVFVRRTGKQNYTFVGNHEVLTRKPTEAELAKARSEVPHTRGVSRIVFLERVETV